MYIKQKGTISTLRDKPLNLVYEFIYIICNISSTENDINIHIGNVRTATDKFSIVWKSDLFDKIDRDFFQTVALFVLLCGYVFWIQTKCIEKILDGNHKQMLRVVLKKPWKKHHTKLQFYGHLAHISEVPVV